jgi:hypothetical protein
MRSMEITSFNSKPGDRRMVVILLTTPPILK